MKVWVVFMGDYEARSAISVCSSREIAIERWKESVPESRQAEKPDIEEFEVDR